MNALFYFWLKGIRWLLFRLFLSETIVYFPQMQFPTRCFWHLILRRDKEKECWSEAVFASPPLASKEGVHWPPRHMAPHFDASATIPFEQVLHRAILEVVKWLASQRNFQDSLALVWTLLKSFMWSAMDTLLRIVVLYWRENCSHWETTIEFLLQDSIQSWSVFDIFFDVCEFSEIDVRLGLELRNSNCF